MNVIGTQLQNYQIPILGPFIWITYRKDILFSFLYTEMSQQISFLTPLFKMPDRNSVSSLASFYGELILKWLYSALLDAPCLVIVVQTLKSCPALCDSGDCSTAGFPAFAISQSLLKFMSIELVMLSNYLILCCPLLHLPSIFPSIRDFSWWVNRQLFILGGQSTGASVSASVLPMNTHSWFPLVSL